MKKILALSLILASLPALAAVDRVQLWRTVENYTYGNNAMRDQYARWAHDPANQSKSQAQAEAELGLKWPDPEPALQAALEVAQANPTDDLGFMALSFCLYTPREEKEAAYRTAAIDLLKRHYLNDMRLGKIILGLARFGGEQGAALLDEVVRHSTERAMQAQAAYWSAYERMRQVDDLSIPEAQRAATRADVIRLAKLVSTEFADVDVGNGKGAEAIKPTLYALEHLSIGSMLPDASGMRIGGGEEKLSRYRGKVVLLDFWATWCVPRGGPEISDSFPRSDKWSPAV